MNSIRSLIRKSLISLHENSSKNKKIWYHGSADARSIKNGFEQRSITTTYINDPLKLKQLEQEMAQARQEGNEKAYWDALNQVDTTKSTIKMKAPIFFTDSRSVANTYATDKVAFDYQNSEPKVLEFDVEPGHRAEIFAPGQLFRKISTDLVKKGFVESGASEKEVEDAMQRLNYPFNIKGTISNVTIALVAQKLGFDSVDVIGVLDSYHGGNVKSTVRIVWDVSRIKPVADIKEAFSKTITENVGDKIGVSIEDVFGMLDPDGAYEDIYPGYEKDPSEYFDQENPEFLYPNKDMAYQEVGDVISMFESMPDPIPIWRSIHVKSPEDINLEMPGDSWSYNKEGAINFARNHALGNVLLHAMCPKDNVDWNETLNVHFLFTENGYFDGSAEEEIRVEREWELKNITWEWIK